MPVIFGGDGTATGGTGNTGRVFAVPDRVAQGSISLGNLTNPAGVDLITYQNQNTIITRIGVSAAGNFQFLHTIGNDVYVYVFGDRMGEITLHGLSFAESCQGPSGAGHGFELLFDFYQQSRIAVNPNVVTVRIGRSTIFKGFMTGITGDVSDSMTRTIQFQMTISLLPDAL